jgi:glycosyltransferase involved in cell wall biosynthesis
MLLTNVKVSVLVVNFNKEQYINRCLESLTNQTFKNFEVIFFDDCSDDNSINEAKKFHRKLNIKIFRNKKKKMKYGSYNQMNSYIQAFYRSKGEILLFLDSDDFFKNNKVLKIVKFFLDKKNKKKKIIFDLPYIFFSMNKIKLFKIKSKIFKKSWPRFSPQSCISVRRNFFLEILNNVTFKKYPNIDLDFRIGVYSYFISNNFTFFKDYLTFYFQDPIGISSKYKFFSKNWWKRRLEAFLFLNYILKKKKLPIIKTFDYFITFNIVRLLSFYENRKIIK